MAELLEESPTAGSTSTSSPTSAVRPLADLIDRTGGHDRVCVGSFSQRRIDAFRRASAVGWPPRRPRPRSHLPGTPLGSRGPRCDPRPGAALQVPHRRGRLPVVTRALVRRAHAAGAHVHVWTVDEPAEMDELLDLGVDGVITDRTDVLKQVLIRRGQWRTHP